MAKKGGLGRGMDALFLENSAADNTSSAVTLGINEIEPNHDQPRKNFDEKALGELAASIEKNGIIQPLLVRPMTDGSYQLIRRAETPADYFATFDCFEIGKKLIEK